MNLPELTLDDLTWADLVDIARRAIPAASEGTWTLHAPVDPGITLVELFAAELEQRLYAMDHVPDTLVRAVMRLFLGAGAGPLPAQPATAVLAVDAPSNVKVPAGTEFRRVLDGQELVLTSEHGAVAAAGARVTGLSVGGVDVWPRLQAREPVWLFGADGRRDARIDVRAAAPAEEHRLYVTVEQASSLPWQVGTAPPPLPRPEPAAPAGGLGWVGDDGSTVLLDEDGMLAVGTACSASDRSAGAAPRWEAEANGIPLELKVRDGTAGLRTSGIIRLRTARSRTFPPAFHLHLRRSAPDERRFTKVSYVALNAVVVRHRRRFTGRRIAVDGLPEPRRDVLVDNAAPVADRPLDRIIDGSGAAVVRAPGPGGDIETWTAVDDLAFSAGHDRHFRIDRERGALVFGDGRGGRIPHWPRGWLEATYWLGGGTSPELGPDVELETGATPQVTARTLTRLSWGRQPETTESARARTSQAMARAVRAVNADDMEALVRRVPGVRTARTLVVDGLDPARPGVRVADSVCVVCVPAVPRERAEHLTAVPAPEFDAESLAAVADALEPSRLIGTRLVVVGPAYHPVELSVEIDVVAGDSLAVIERSEAVVRHYLDPVVGGRDGGGWPFGAPVGPPDVAALLQGVLREAGDVRRVVVAEVGGQGGTDCAPLPLRSYELPRLDRLVVRRVRGWSRS